MVKYFPILATVMLDSAGIGHIVQMFKEQSSAGQSIFSYIMIIGALFLWEAFYRIRTPGEKFAVWSARFGIGFNLAVLCAIVYYR